MRREERRWFSGNLGHDMDLIVYGHGGQPLICFPSSNGRTRDWEGFGMVDCVADLIEAGRLLMVAVDGIDWQSWSNKDVSVEQRARRHNDYYRCRGRHRHGVGHRLQHGRVPFGELLLPPARPVRRRNRDVRPVPAVAIRRPVQRR